MFKLYNLVYFGISSLFLFNYLSKLFYFFYFNLSTLFLFNQLSKLFDFFHFDVLTLFLFNQMFFSQSKLIMIFELTKIAFK